VIGRIAPLYQHSIQQLWQTVYADRIAAANEHPGLEESISMLKVQRSAQWLADHFDEVPLYLFGFVQADPTGGSIFPAIWSAQLAARAHGVGSSLTVVLGFFHPDEVFEILGVPGDEHWVMACCVSFGYPKGRWGGRSSSAGAGSLVPQPVGITGRVHCRPTALARRHSGSRRLSDMCQLRSLE
jgi:hypothetical protein